jgi:hypothetical protein
VRDNDCIWQQINRSGLSEIIGEAVLLDWGPLSIVSTIEELLERESSGSGLETEITAVGIRRTDYATSLHPLKVDTNFTDKRR